MVNKKGGKGYKKGKGNNDNIPDFPEPGEGALFARVLRILGNCRIIAYCNDNERRVCHIRGAMRKRVWINAGDVILVSTREFESGGGAGTDDPLDKKFENADVLAKYDTKHYSRLKKEPGFNAQLLVELEKIDFDANGVGHKIQALLAAAKDGDTVKIDYETGEAKVEETGYEWDRGDSDEEAAALVAAAEGDDDPSKPDYKKRHKIQDAKRTEARGNKETTTTTEINIDDI